MSNPSKILILEDEPLITIDVETLLNERGLTDVEIFTAVEPAIGWLKEHTPHLAILDYYLGHSTTESIAEELVKMDVPFIVCSAAEREETSSAFDKGHWVSKPYVDDQLVLTALRLLDERSRSL